MANRLSQRGLSCLLALCLCALSGFATSAKTADTTYEHFCARGVGFLERDRLDSAFYAFARAYKHGMPPDSLYYFWAEVYIDRGVYDSALALNYAIGSVEERRFERRVLEQRLELFQTLGWEEHADTIADSLMGYPAYVARLFVPDITLGAGGGFRRFTELVDTTYPWGTPGTAARERESRYDAEGTLRLDWPLAFVSRDRLHTGVETTVARRFAPDSTFSSIDSLEYGLYAFIQASRIADRLFAGYTLGIRRDELGDRYFSHQLGVSVLVPLKNMPTFLSIGYMLEDSLDGGALYHSFWAYSSTELLNRGRSKLGVSLMGSGLVGKTSREVFDTVRVVYTSNTESPLPTFYRDERYTSAIDTTGINSYEVIRFLNTIRANAGLQVVERITPQTSFRFSPDCVYSYRFASGISMSVGFDWELSYYPELFEWMILPQDFDASKWYTLHDNSGEWYYIEGEVNVALGSRALDLVPISDDIDVYEVRRVDNTVGATVSLQKGLGIMGSVELEGSLSRTWSSLPPNAPVDIPEWSGGVRLSWEKKLGIR